MNTILEQTEEYTLRTPKVDPAEKYMERLEAEERAKETYAAVQTAVDVGRAIAGDNEAAGGGVCRTVERGGVQGWL